MIPNNCSKSHFSSEKGKKTRLEQGQKYLLIEEINESHLKQLFFFFLLHNIVLVHLVKAMVFPVVMYGCESWIVKKAERRRIDAFDCGVGEDS